jgi:uncharacterized Rmd1/YagE family protein
LRFDAIDRRFDAVDRKIDVLREELGTKINEVDAKIEKRFMWTIRIVLTTGLSTIGTTIAAIYLHH